MNKRIQWNEDLIKNFVKNNTPYDFIKFKKYNKANSILILYCNVHNVEFCIRFSKLKIGQGCPKCAMEKRGKSRLKWSIDKIISYIEDNSKYTIINIIKINGRKTILDVICDRGHRRIISFETILQDAKCKICFDEDKVKNNNIEILKNKIIKKGIGKKVELLEIIYYNSHENSLLLLKCLECGYIFTSTYSNLFYTPHLNYCRKCANKHLSEIKSMDINEVKEYIESFNYKLLSDYYKNNTTYIKVECEKGHKYTTTYGAFKNGNRCPYCNQSKGEYKIKKFFKNNNMIYNEQKRFEDCRFKKPLPFDFYLPQYNILIEYDGEFHYKISRYEDGFDKFINTKIRDTVKNIYCKNNDIKLIRIPYWEYDNIEEILIKELNLK